MSIQILDQSAYENLEASFYDLSVKKGIFTPINDRSFRYKDYMIVRGPDDSWNIFHLAPRKKLLATTFLKVTAFAYCKEHEKKHHINVREMLAEDSNFKKNYIDSIFYKNTFKKTKDETKKDTALWRYEIVYQRAKHSKAVIDRLFYRSIA